MGTDNTELTQKIAGDLAQIIEAHGEAAFFQALIAGIETAKDHAKDVSECVHPAFLVHDIDRQFANAVAAVSNARHYLRAVRELSEAAPNLEQGLAVLGGV
jgi:hypothetical protein